MNYLTSELVFYVLAAIALISAFLVIVKSNPVTSAIFLIISFACAAGVMFQLDAQFLGVIQILVYTGAIMVLILFVVMLLNLGDEPRSFRRPLPTICGLVIAGLFMAQLTGVIYSIPGAKESCKDCGEGCKIFDAFSEFKVPYQPSITEFEGFLDLDSSMPTSNKVVISQPGIEDPLKPVSVVKEPLNSSLVIITPNTGLTLSGHAATEIPPIGHSPSIKIPRIAFWQPIVERQANGSNTTIKDGDFPDTKLLGYRLFSKYNTELVIAGLALLIGTIGSVVFSRNVKNQ